MEKLNSDAKMQILMKLTGDEIVKVCQTSKDLYRACNEERYTPLWRQKIKNEFNIDYNGQKGYDKYRDLRTIFGTTYYIVKVINTEQPDNSYVSLCVTKEQAENYIVVQLVESFTYAQVKSALEASGFVRDSHLHLSIQQEKMSPTLLLSLDEEKRIYKDEYEKFKGNRGKEFDKSFKAVVNGFNDAISNGLAGENLDVEINQSVEQFVQRFNMQGREDEVRNFITKNILIEKEDE